jgi:hypothetical protein
MSRWVPASAAEGFRAAAEEALNGWALRWNLPRVGSTVEILPAASSERFTAPWRALHPGGDAWLRDDGLARSLQRPLFGQGGDGGIAEQVAARATATLVAVLESLATPGESESRDVTGARLPGHWGIRCAFSAGDAQLELAVSNRSLARGGWIQKVGRPPLERRALDSALAKVPVALTVELGSCEVSLRDIAGLAPGDLVLSAVPSHQPMRVVSDSGHLVMAGLLGRAEGSRALQLSSLKS